jgi:hypothetical protein
MITAFDSSNLKTLRADLDAALAVIAEKHGITLEIGRIGFSAGEFRAQMTGKVEAIAAEQDRSLLVSMASVFGLDIDRVAQTPQGEARLIGYRSRAKTKRWEISLNGKPGYVADQRFVNFYFKEVEPKKASA